MPRRRRRPCLTDMPPASRPCDPSRGRTLVPHVPRPRRLGRAGPGPVATAWAEEVRRAGRFGVVTGHTVVPIRVGHGRQSALYAWDGVRRLGPQADEGRPDDALHHYFPSLQ